MCVTPHHLNTHARAPHTHTHTHQTHTHLLHTKDNCCPCPNKCLSTLFHIHTLVKVCRDTEYSWRWISANSYTSQNSKVVITPEWLLTCQRALFVMFPFIAVCVCVCVWVFVWVWVCVCMRERELFISAGMRVFSNLFPWLNLVSKASE